MIHPRGHSLLQFRNLEVPPADHATDVACTTNEFSVRFCFCNDISVKRFGNIQVLSNIIWWSFIKGGAQKRKKKVIKFRMCHITPRPYQKRISYQCDNQYIPRPSFQVVWDIHKLWIKPLRKASLWVKHWAENWHSFLNLSRQPSAPVRAETFYFDDDPMAIFLVSLT